MVTFTKSKVAYGNPKIKLICPGGRPSGVNRSPRAAEAISAASVVTIVVLTPRRSKASEASVTVAGGPPPRSDISWITCRTFTVGSVSGPSDGAV
jgi:hypothetical protein